jgi:hypothetical protein
MRFLILAAALVTTSAHAEPFDSSYYFSLGALVAGECRKAGYTVDPNAWHALASMDIPDYDPSDYQKGGKHGKLNSIVFATLVRVLKQNTSARFCENVMEWAHAKHPRVGRSLIDR